MKLGVIMKVGDLVEWIEDEDIGIVTCIHGLHAYIQWKDEPEKSSFLRQDDPKLRKLS